MKKLNRVMITRLQLNIAPITIANGDGTIRIILTNGTSVLVKLNKEDVEDALTMVGDNHNTVLILRNAGIEINEQQKSNKEIQNLFGGVSG